MATKKLGTVKGVDVVLITSANLATEVTGVLAVTNGGTGQSVYTDGQLLIGNTTGNTLTKSTLTAGPGITITNGSGAITIATTTVGGSVVTAFTAQTSVTVTHNLAQYPVVDVIDNAGAVLVPFSITHASVNAFTVVLSTSTTGNIIATLGMGGGESYATGSFTIVTGSFRIHSKRLTLTTTERVTLAGTSRLRIT